MKKLRVENAFPTLHQFKEMDWQEYQEMLQIHSKPEMARKDGKYGLLTPQNLYHTTKERVDQYIQNNDVVVTQVDTMRHYLRQDVTYYLPEVWQYRFRVYLSNIYDTVEKRMDLSELLSELSGRKIARTLTERHLNGTSFSLIFARAYIQYMDDFHLEDLEEGGAYFEQVKKMKPHHVSMSREDYLK